MSNELQAKYNAFKATIEQIQEKLVQLEEDADQHKKVLGLLADVDGDRKCMRMIGTVLVEQTVSEATPRLKETLAGLENAISTLQDDLKTKTQQMETWKTANKIKVVSS